MRFLFLADMQIGAYASFSGLTEADVARLAVQGLKVRAAPKSYSLEWDIRRLDAAIVVANRLRPDLVIVGGDMVNDAADAAQRDAFFQAIGHLDPDIPIRWGPGNHDVTYDWSAPTVESLRQYRDRFGPDYYAFDHGPAAFVVWNTAVAFDPTLVPGEWEAQLAFLETALEGAAAHGRQPILIGHHPLFVETPDEADTYWNIPTARRRPVLDLIHRFGVRIGLAGHLHRGAWARDGAFEMVTSGPVGYPLGDDPSGFRVVEVTPEGIAHAYHALDVLDGD